MIRFCFCFVFSLCILAPRILAQESDGQKSVLLGVILSESGPAKEVSASWFQGVQLAIDTLQAQGERVFIRTENAGSSASKTATAYTALVQNHKVQGVIGGSLDYLLERLVPLTKVSRVPVVSPSVPQEALSEKANNSPFVRTTSYSIAGAERALEPFFSKHLTRTCAFVFGDSKKEQAWLSLYRKSAEQNSCETIYEKQITYKDFRSQIVSAAVHIARKRPDVVIVPLDVSGVQILSRELFRQGAYPLFVTGPEFETAFELSPRGEHYKNFFVLYPEYFAKEFYSDFMKKYADKPSLYSAAGYDATILLYQAISQERELAEVSRSDMLMKDSMSLKRVHDGMLEVVTH